MRGGEPGGLSGRSFFALAAGLGWLVLASAACFSPGQRLRSKDGLSAPRRLPRLPGSSRHLTPPQAQVTEPGAGLDLDNVRVGESVRIFQARHRRFMAQALARSQSYVPIVSTILAREGVPSELAYMPIVESGYRCDALSPTGAVGPWQFIRSTAIRYGLHIGQAVDERKDPIRSTHAAARYLADLYDRFGDWHLAVAAYNSGEGKIEAALSRSGASSFWELWPHLSSETRRFVPQVLAAATIARAPEEYGFYLPPEPAPEPRRSLASSAPPAKPNRPKILRYRVVRGDTLAAIARRYRIPLATLRAYNRVPNPRRLMPGQLLTIPVRPRAAS